MSRESLLGAFDARILALADDLALTTVASLTSAITWPLWLLHLRSRHRGFQIALSGTLEGPPHNAFAADLSGLALAQRRGRGR